MKTYIKCNGSLIVLPCGCLQEKEIAVVVEPNPGCDKHKPVSRQYKKRANDKKAQLDLELKS